MDAVPSAPPRRKIQVKAGGRPSPQPARLLRKGCSRVPLPPVLFALRGRWRGGGGRLFPALCRRRGSPRSSLRWTEELPGRTCVCVEGVCVPSAARRSGGPVWPEVIFPSPPWRPAERGVGEGRSEPRRVPWVPSLSPGGGKRRSPRGSGEGGTHGVSRCGVGVERSLGAASPQDRFSPPPRNERGWTKPLGI